MVGKTVPDDDADVQSWCEAITWTAARKIALSSKKEAWKSHITWFAGKGMQFSSYCECLQHLLAKQTSHEED